MRLKRERNSKPACAEVERYSAALHYQPDGVRRDFSPAARFSSDWVWDGLSEGVSIALRETEREA